VTKGTTGLILAALLVLLTTGCGDQADGAAQDRKPSPTSVPDKAYTVEQLAAAVGCEPKFQGKAADFRQAGCTVDGDPFVFLQFDKAEGQQAWLEYATLYGGIYLVGDRWVLSGKSKEYMEDLKGTLGGSVKENKPDGS